MKDIYKRHFEFGKVAYWPKSRRSNAVEVDVELRRLSNGEWEFSASGEIWNCRHTDCCSFGQNLDEIRKYLKGDGLFDEIYELWSKHHLNGMNCGTRRQHAALEEESRRREGEEPLTHASRYEDACEYLKSIGLYEDALAEDEALSGRGGDCDPRAYRYGTGWVTWRLDGHTLDRMMSLLKRGKVLGTDAARGCMKGSHREGGAR